MDLSQVYSRIDSLKDEMTSSLTRLISIPSTAVPTPGKYPFGEPVQKAWETMMEMAHAEGFRVFNADNFGGHMDLPGSGDGICGIVGHLDVVPEGGGWDFPPYSGEIIDGYLCGRGTMDDKGPVVASFYAMKALKECGYRPDKTVRLILGLDEETNWDGMRHYLAFADSLPDCGFTPDGDFPVIRGEMGILIFDIVRKFSKSSGKGLELRSLTGGTAANSVADSARAVLFQSSGGYEEIRAVIDAIREEKQWDITCKGIGRSLEICTAGRSAHGARPEKGLNAVSMMMEILAHLNFAEDGITDFIRFYNRHIGFSLHGENIGCALEDDASGKLIWNTGMISLDRNSVRLTINVRYPVTADFEQIYAGIMDVLGPYELGIIKELHRPPIFFPADDPMITTLMDVYRGHTGDTDSEPLVIGGGTYARAMDGIVAFGARFPGEPELGHQKNEKISVDNLLRLAKIYAEAIFRLAGEAPEEPQESGAPEEPGAPEESEEPGENR